MTHYQLLQAELIQSPKTWLVTGVAGFIGSNLLETLLRLNQRVVGLDNFATGHQRNLDEVQTLVAPVQWANFQFVEGDIRNLVDCQAAMTWRSPTGALPKGEPLQSDGVSVDYVLHQAALGSVPRSLADPIATNETNITGFLNMLVTARDAKVQSFTYAASSSTYGDHPALPKVEDSIGKPLSPYAVTKYVNELYADLFARSYGFNTIGLRYFNIFGQRQDPDGAYAAVIPKWIYAMINNQPIYINGDGETSRDFCYIENTVQANLLAATCNSPSYYEWVGREQSRTETTCPTNQVYNIAVGDSTSLNQLYFQLRDNLSTEFPHLENAMPVYRDFRAGDVRHSLADISKAIHLLGYKPEYRIADGLKKAMEWYVEQQHRN